MSEPYEIELTPNYGRIFRLMLRDARDQSEPRSLFRDLNLNARTRAEALRAVQRFLAPLNVAAQCMADREAVEAFRETLAKMVTAMDMEAGEIETALADDDAAADLAHADVDRQEAL